MQKLILRKGKAVFVMTLLVNVAIAQSDNLQRLKEYVDNGQLVIYTGSSIVSSSSASSLTYVDFCADGTYFYDYEGSFVVKGTKHTSSEDSMASGAGVSKNSGTWQIMENQGSFVLEVTDYMGQKGYYPINIQNLLAGKWKYGNTTYVFAPKKGRCGR
ncbi:MAG: hypothetical protein AAGD88_11970 [Bacteroidota bacterium]